MMRAIRPPESKQATTLLVAVRCRPLTLKEQTRSRDILRVVDDKVVVVLDPDSSKEYLDRVQNRSKEKKYAFDVAFGSECTNKDVYDVTVGSMIEGVLRGLNATVFAYGATGSGKTHTMAGLPEDPGLMVLSLQEIFALITRQEHEHEFEVTCSYLEVYNEVIYDLLEKSSGHLELREDPDQGITVAGLKRIQVNSAEKILELLNLGNSRRKTESTNANATSSRSHAVLEIIVKRKQRNQYRSQVLRGKLALVDLAGSERASETNNAGQKLRDGANINRSLLALANCINALGKQQKKGLAYVPYRNSKLTRLLKDGLSGNSRTVMVATVSCADDQYHHTTNTLKYADRAKEIKTHIQTNVGTVDAHVADYQRMIDNLQVEVSQLRRELAEKETQLSARTPEKADDELSWLDVLSHDINENVEMRVNLQKALFELEDMNLHNRMELQQLDELIAQQQDDEADGEKLEDLIERRQVVLDNIRDNDEAGAHYRQDIEQNEKQRKELQRQIDEAISSNRNKTYLRILSQYRLLGMTNMELQFQMAIRDQIIQDQREALNNMWHLLESSGLNRDQILEIAAQQGIMIEDGMPVSGRSASNGPPLHVQPMTPSARFSNIIQLPRSEAESSKEFRVSSNGSVREQLDTPISPSTPNMDWRLTDNDTSGQAVSLKGKSLGNSTPLPDVRAQGDAADNGKDLSPEKFREICKQVLLESGVLGRTDAAAGGLETPCSCSSRIRSQTAQGSRKVVTPAKHKRKPRSADCRPRQCSQGVIDGNTTGVDAGSEGSETEDSDHCLSHPNTRQMLHKTTGTPQSVDNKMLQRELSRLDNELQDLKRGIERNSSLQAFNSSRSHTLHTSLETTRGVSSRNSSSPFLGNKAVVTHSNSSDFPKSAPVTGHVPYSQRVSSGQAQPSFSTVATPMLESRRQWGGGRVGSVGSVDIAAAAAGSGQDIASSRVFLFTPPELADGGRTISSFKSKGLTTDRISPPARGRQLWPRNIPEWTA